MKSILQIFFIWLLCSPSVRSLLEDTSKLEMTMSYVYSLVQPEMSPLAQTSTKGTPSNKNRLPKRTQDEYIKGLAKYSKENPAIALEAFKSLIVGTPSLRDLNFGGELDVRDTWKRYIVDTVPGAFGRASPSTSNQKEKEFPSKSGRKKKKTIAAAGQENPSSAGQMDSLQYDSDKRLRRLADKMRRWYIDSGKKSTSLNDEHSIQEIKLQELQNWEAKDLTENAWSFTIRFLHLHLMWKEKGIVQNIVTQMAIFEHFKQFPKLSTERTSNILGGNRHEADKVALREFCGLVTSPRHFNTEWDLHKVINRMIPFPHKLSFLSFPIISEFVGVCPQEYFAVSELIAHSIEEAPTMELNDPILWNGFTMIATKTKNEPIMRAYKGLLLYFRNGIPHDKTFDYYQLISKITLDFKQWKETENQKLLKTCSQRTSKEKVKAINDKLLPLREKNSAEMESRFLSDKVHLFLNYAEEFNKFRRIGNTGGFQLSPRATRSQISQIAFLFCQIFSPRNGMQLKESLRLDETLKKFNDEIISTNLPKSVKRKMFDISFQFCHMTKKHMLRNKDIEFNNPLWNVWEKKFSQALNSGANSQQEVATDSRVDSEQVVRFSSTGTSQSQHKIETFQLQENHQVWEAVWNIVDRELSAMSTNSAKILLEKLDGLQTYSDGQHILGKIYEAMNSLDTYSERINAMGIFWENMMKLKPLTGNSIERMQESEFENLKKLYETILENLQGFNLDKTQWEEKVFPIISNMSFHSKMIVDDLIWEFPNSEKLFGKKGETWIESVAKNPYESEIILDKLLENAKEFGNMAAGRNYG